MFLFVLSFIHGESEILSGKNFCFMIKESGLDNDLNNEIIYTIVCLGFETF